MEPQSLEKMGRQLGTKKHFPVIIWPLLCLIGTSSCDPSKGLVLQNYSDNVVQLSIKTQRSWFQEELLAIDSLFEKKIDHSLFQPYMKAIRHDSLIYSFRLPSRHSVLVGPGGIGHIPIDWVVIHKENSSDTIFINGSHSPMLPSNVKIRHSGFMFSQLIADIH